METRRRLDRPTILRAGLAAAASFGLAGRPLGARAAKASPPSMTPNEALRRLMAGNANFVAGHLLGTSAIAERRADVANVQKPFAMVLACADSRIPPEHVFDQGVGDLFVCRVAGNIAEPGGIGSFEYAATAIGTPAVLMVLCHQRCGAITDSIDLIKSGKPAPGDIQAIVSAIKPAMDATSEGSMSPADYVEAVAQTNAKIVARSIESRSKILHAAVTAGTLKVVAARYSLDSGKVVLLT